MAEIVMHTWDKAGTSIRVIADDLTEYMRDLGHNVEVMDKKVDPGLCNHKYVFSTREHLSMEFVRMFRFVKPKAYVALHTRNLEEFTDEQWAAYMVAFVHGSKGGSPLQGVSYSQYQYDQLAGRLRSIFSPTWSRKILGNTNYIPYGIRDEFQPRGENDKQRWIVPFNRVTNTQKNVKLHTKVISQFQMRCALAGLPSPTHCYRYAEGYGPDDTSSKGIDLSLYDVARQPDTRKQYMDEVGQYGMALSTSLYESFGIYYLELLASGCVVVFLDRPWIRKLLPDYKFLAKEGDLVDMLLATYSNYDAASRYLHEEVIPYIDGTFRLRRFVDEFLGVAAL